MPKMDRRTFLQMSLAAISLSSAASATSTLRAVASARKGPEPWVSLILTLENSADKPVDVMLRDTPDKGILTRVETGGKLVKLQESPFEERALMSRAGPQRSWWPVPAKGRWQVGEFRLQAGELSFPCVLTLDLDIRTSQGVHQIHLEDVSVLTS